MKQRVGVLLAVAVFGWICASPAQVTTGTISGTVIDSSGAVVPGANIAILNEDTGISRSVQADAAGRYSAPSLGLGNYRVTASKEGFQSETRTGIVLTVGREAVVDFRLSVGAVAQSLEVTGEAPLVQTTEATMSNLVNGTSIQELPLNGRDLSQLILLSPNVTQAVDSKSTYSYNGFGRRISIAGFQGEDNAYLLDGGWVDDFYHHIPAGPTGELLGVETVQEFTVLTSTFGAQYGRALGGVFNAVSRSGTNSLHGDVFEFLRNSDLDARSFFDLGGGPPAFRRNQFGATIGGPIQKDKTFFFASYEGLRQTLGITNSAVVPTAAAWQGNLGTGSLITVSPKILAYQSLFPLPTPGGLNYGGGEGQYIFVANTPTNFDFGQARIDHQFSTKDSFFARFSGSNSNSIASQNLPEFTGNLSLGFDYLTLSETHVFSPALLNSTHFQFDRVTPADLGGYPATPAGAFSYPGAAPPAFVVTGLTSVEGLTKPLDYYTTNRFGFQDDVNLVRGNHSMSFGGMFERIQFNMQVPDRPFGEWTFNSLSGLLAATPTQYRGTPPGVGNPIRGWRQDEMALYFQDDWKVTPKLTLNLGVRWEPYTIPTEVNGLVANLRHLTDPNSTIGNPMWINQSWKNIGPRFGFAWSPFTNGKTSIRGGFGEYFVPTDTPYLQDVGTRVPPLYPFYQIPNPSPSSFPNALPLLQSIGSAFTSGDVIPYQHMNTQHSLSWNLSVQQQIGANEVLTLGYEGNRGIDILGYLSENTPVPIHDGVSLAVPAGSSQATLPNPAFNNVSFWANAANSWYNAFTARFERRFAAGLTAGVSYTFAKALTEADGGKVAGSDLGSGSVVKDAFNLPSGKMLSGYDIRNAFVASADYQLPFGKGVNGLTSHLISGWETTGILTVQGGLPVTLTAGSPSTLSALNVGGRTPNSAGCPYSQIAPGIHFVSGAVQYFNPQCYTFPSALELGNVAENSVIGPGLVALNYALARNFAVTERMHLQFRAEAFNLTNRPNFGQPALSLFSGTGGRTGNAGQITNVVTAAPGRQIQFGLKLIF